MREGRCSYPRRAAILALALAALAMPSGARACSCMPQTEAEAIQRADEVFSGRVISVMASARGARVSRGNRAVLAVIRIEKGRLPRRVTVLTASSSAACGVTFVPGRLIRLAANRDRAGLTATLCNMIGLKQP